MAAGAHKIEYEVLEGWNRLPEDWSCVEVAGVACDSQDRVYVFNRGAEPGRSKTLLVAGSGQQQPG